LNARLACPAWSEYSLSNLVKVDGLSVLSSHFIASLMLVLSGANNSLWYLSTRDWKRPHQYESGWASSICNMLVLRLEQWRGVFEGEYSELLTMEEYVDFRVINNEEVLHSEYTAGPTIAGAFKHEVATVGGHCNVGTRNALLLLVLPFFDISRGLVNFDDKLASTLIDCVCGRVCARWTRDGETGPRSLWGWDIRRF
jgi:hypothetical protein